MKDEPIELTSEKVDRSLRDDWGIGPAELTYAPVGHGSYHWIGSDRAGPRWFVTADYLAPEGEQRFGTLESAADTARRLADDGCEFVLGPLPDRTGTLLRRVLPDWAMQVFPYLPGWSTDQGAWTDPVEQAAVARLVGRLHSATPPSTVPRWEFAIPGRETLEAALDDLDRPWIGGPYAEPTRALLIESRATIGALVRRYDELVREIEADADPWVVTHGEPDSDNLVRGDDGGLYLIDWGTVRLAPRERDLVEILNGVADVLPAYQETAGPYPARPAGLELFGLGWSLTDIRRTVERFGGPHDDSAGTAAAWQRLRDNVEHPGDWFRPPTVRT